MARNESGSGVEDAPKPPPEPEPEDEPAPDPKLPFVQEEGQPPSSDA